MEVKLSRLSDVVENILKFKNYGKKQNFTN